MTKKQQTDLAELVSNYNSLSQSVKAQTKQLETAKAVIAAYVDKYNAVPEFVDGELVLFGPQGERVGMLKQVNGAPKLVKVGSGLDLTDVQKQRLIGKLPERYIARTFNMALIRDERDAKDLAAVLMKQEVEIEQNTRYDIKP